METEEDKVTGTLAREGRVDMLEVASLASWLEEGLGRLGRRRLEGVVETYYRMAGIDAGMRDVLLSLMALDGDLPERAAVPLRESLRALAELEAVLSSTRLNPRTAAARALLGARPWATPK